MKSKIGLILLALVAVVLAGTLLWTKQQAEKRQDQDASTILDFSNQWTKASLDVDELRQVNLTLNRDLATNQAVLTDLSNTLTTVSETVTNTRAALQSAQDEITSQSTRITDLQAQNQELDAKAKRLTDQALELTNTIIALNLQISDTVKALSASKTYNSDLEKQLQVLIADKAELEHNFNTLAVVREQVSKLRAELVAARRLQWMKDGTDVQLKGAQILVQHRDAASHAPGTNYGLNVEIGSNGSVKVIPPGQSGSTNNPATDSAATNSAAH
jgi:predicted  nucleic acid-binding Zn-ribbon protein